MTEKTGSLVITRKCNQCFSIGDEIIVEIACIKRNLVTVRITAPVSLKVNRIEKGEFEIEDND